MHDRTIKHSLKQLLRRFGWDVRRYRPYLSFDERLIALIERCGVDLAIDVGANEGQYGRRLRSNGYRGRIVSFEPLRGAHAALVNEARKDNAWYVGARLAIGDHDGMLKLNVSRNSVSSSSLNMLPIHTQAAVGSETIGVESVKVSTLDDAMAGLIKPTDSVLLKIDVQGAEDKVLAGAEHVFSQTRAIQIELSLVPVYEGQLLAFDVMEILNKRGFDLADIKTEFVDPRDGRLLQVDGLFVSRNVQQPQGKLSRMI